MPGKSKGRVLLAEDDDDLLNGLTDLLRSNGYEVTPVSDGTTLLDSLSRSLLLERDRPPPDAVISDIRLPGFNGLSILEGLRWSGWMTPFILMSAFGDPRIKERARTVGATAFLDKPLDLTRLENLVADAVETEREKPRHARRALAAMVEHASIVEAVRCLREEDWDEIVVVRETGDGYEAWGRLTTEILLDRLLEVELDRLSELTVGDLAGHWRDAGDTDRAVHRALRALETGEAKMLPCVVRGARSKGALLSHIHSVDSSEGKMIH